MSDEVFEKLTGIRGAFRTRIAYVVQKNGGAPLCPGKEATTLRVT